MYEWLSIVTTGSKLKLNFRKSSFIAYTRETKKFITYSYTFDNVVIPTVTGIKYPGVYTDTHLHCICWQALKMIGFLSRSTRGFKSVECLLKLYVAHILSRVDHCSLVCSKFYFVDVPVSILFRELRHFSGKALF